MAEATSTELAIADNNTAMMDSEPEQKSGFLDAIGTADMMRQVTLVVALVICVAIAVFIVIWAQQPDYRPLGKMTTDELIQTLDYFDQNQIEYKLEGNIVYVRENQYQDVKLGMAREGISGDVSAGDDIIMQDMGFGVSQRVEMERLKHAREQQLARTIEEMRRDQPSQGFARLAQGKRVFPTREKGGRHGGGDGSSRLSNIVGRSGCNN